MSILRIPDDLTVEVVDGNVRLSSGIHTIEFDGAFGNGPVSWSQLIERTIGPALLALRMRNAERPGDQCPAGHGLMHYDIADDRLHCHCGAVATTHGNIIVDPDPVVDMEPKRG